MNQTLLILLVLINAGIYLYMVSSPRARQDMIARYAIFPGVNKSGEWYRLVTSAFLHNDIFHIFLNMYSLAVLYPTVVAVINRVLVSGFGVGGLQYALLVFLLLYIFSAIIGGLVSSGRRDQYIPSIGASGAIFGLLGFLLSFGLLTFGTGGSQLVSSILYVLIINFGIGLMPGFNIDNRGHFGGLIGGILFAILAFIFLV